MKTIRLVIQVGVWLGLLLLMIFGINLILPNQPLQGQGDCGSGYAIKIENAPFEYHSDQPIVKVFVKSSTNCFSLTIANPSDGCYQAIGLGTTDVKVIRIGEASPECQEISHVEFYLGIIPTDTPTHTTSPTNTETPTQTVTQTVEPTSTETITQTPTVTDWNVVASPTVTGTRIVETETPAPSETPTSPPKNGKTKTPEVILPATGEFRPSNLRYEFTFGFAALGGLIVGLLWILKRKA